MSAPPPPDAPTSSSTRVPSDLAGGRSLLWLKSGLLGGALAGALDVVLSIAGRIGGLSAGKAVRLLVLAASLIAAAGLLVGALIAFAGWMARRTRAPARTAALLAAVGAAPLVVYDAFALFTGHRAASVPAHGAISAALALGALCAVGWGAHVYGGRLARAQAATTRAWTAPAALFAVGVGCQLANRLVLPRLYQWFHLSLAAATLIAFVLAFRLRTRGGRAAGVGLLAAATALACVVSLIGLGRSQGLRYAAYERTALTALALRALPAGQAAHTAAGAGVARERPIRPVIPILPILPILRRSPPGRAARRPTSCSSPSTPSGTITSAPTVTPATRRPISTSSPPRGRAFLASIPRRRTPRSPCRRC